MTKNTYMKSKRAMSVLAIALAAQSAQALDSMQKWRLIHGADFVTVSGGDSCSAGAFTFHKSGEVIKIHLGPVIDMTFDLKNPGPKKSEASEDTGCVTETKVELFEKKITSHTSITGCKDQYGSNAIDEELEIEDRTHIHYKNVQKFPNKAEKVISCRFVKK